MEHAIAVALGTSHAQPDRFPAGHSAEVIVFEARSPKCEQATPLSRAEIAADRLHQATLTQQAAIAVWREALNGTAQSIRRLEESMTLYDRRLAMLNLTDLEESSLRLATMMDGLRVARG